jgi:hypothetical protein
MSFADFAKGLLERQFPGVVSTTELLTKIAEDLAYDQALHLTENQQLEIQAKLNEGLRALGLAEVI